MKYAYDIIKKPIITERSMMGAQDNKYTFEVAIDAGKVEIKKAVEEIFGVKAAGQVEAHGRSRWQAFRHQEGSSYSDCRF